VTYYYIFAIGLDKALSLWENDNMQERSEAEMREWGKTLETGFLWSKLGDVLQPIVMPPVVGRNEPIQVFDDRTKGQLVRAGRQQNWDNLLKIVKSFTNPGDSYHGSFILKEEVDERAFQNYPHDYFRFPSLVGGENRYFGDIREKGEAYNEMYILMDELVQRANK